MRKCLLTQIFYENNLAKNKSQEICRCEGCYFTMTANT